ncbi:MAG TPA: spore cortex biosynthesis protein YabQ [Oscillospiraceae bacterium]|nr:spore cortex biosynthesis protein YabQ [Oscillospiraceae bacterium]HPF56907.1 spore cortex biosynthesis protein YabQ [Clostridiales bacterium]HPK35573.1 spore cortex biosynthesis protein YabQ [Oscillospiraceae bacterium]HPR75890.1 spore cortex biosynthesis protein YabQ [Oscillospiraceae bacterium]
MNPIIDSEPAYALSVFLLSCLLGIILSVFYGFFKILRIAIKFNAVAIAFQDFFFWFFSGTAVFMFALWQNDGIVRGYVLIGVLVGALAYYLTIGALITRSATAIIGFFQRISGKIKYSVHQRREAFDRKWTAAKTRRKHEKEQAQLKKAAEREKRPKNPKKRRKKKGKTLEFESSGVV